MTENSHGDQESWIIIHIPDNQPILPHLQPTVDVYASIINPKHANTIVRKLNQIAPLENLRHVKRVHKKLAEAKTQLSVILYLVCEDKLLDDVPSGMLELIMAYQLSTFITKVCKYAATSKEQWVEQCKLWPTSFHPPTYNISGITGFSEEDSLSVFRFMKLAVDLAKYTDCQVVNAAVIVDPSFNQVIARSRDWGPSWANPITTESLEAGSLDQCALASFNLVTNGVPNYKPSSSNCSSGDHKKLYDGVSCLHPWQWAEQ